MRAEIAATPEFAGPTLVTPSERAPPLASAEVETALIGRILWRRRRTIALAAVLAALAALAYCLATTPQYTAIAQILVDPRDKQVVRDDVNPSSIAADGGVTQVESQGSVLQSSGVLLRAIAATHLDEDSEFNGAGLLSALSRLWKSPDPGEMAERQMAETLQTLRKHIVVKRADKVLVLDLAVRAKTAERAAELANAVADAYLADQADSRAGASREASHALAGRLDELQGDVKRADDAVADYRASHGFVVSSGQLVSDQELNQSAAQLSNAQSRVASLKAQLDQLRAHPDSQGTPEAMASGVMVRLRDRESAVVERLASASRQLGPLHPEIASLEQSLSEVRGLIAKETQRLRQAAQADYARAQDDAKALAQKLDAMKARSLDDDKADVRLRELRQQEEAARSIYQAFLTRSKETLEAANVDTTNARIITRALPPLQKSWPPTLLLVPGAALLGLSLGASGALAREYAQPTLMTPRQARDLIDAPVLGVVPAGELDAAAARRRNLDAVALASLRALYGGDGDNPPAIGRFLHLASPAALAGARARLAEAIATRAAEEGREVLLIEGDFAGPAAGEPDAERAGLADLLRGDRSVADLAYRDRGEPFARLARGGGDPFATAARGGDAFRLRRVRRCYDLVVLDGGAMSDNVRVAPLAAEADLVLLVAAIGAPQADISREEEGARASGARFDAVALIDATAA